MNAIRFLVAGIGALLSWAVLLPVLVVASPLWGVGRLAALLHRARFSGARRPLPWTDLVQYEETIGWRPRSNLRAYAQEDRAFQLTTDAEGWRGDGSIDGADVLVVGDSFAFGSGVDDREFFAGRAEAHVKALGANGYDMVQGLMWMRRLSSRMSGKLVVWMVYYGNDLYENLQPSMAEYRAPFVRERPDGSGWELVTSHVNPAPWAFPEKTNYYARMAEISTNGLLSQRAFSACRHLVGEARDVCSQAGAALAVVGIPDPTQLDEKGHLRLKRTLPDPDLYEPNLMDQRLRDVCSSLDVPFLALSTRLETKDYKRHNCHWNADGHGRVARVIDELYRELGAGAPAAASAPKPKGLVS